MESRSASSPEKTIAFILNDLSKLYRQPAEQWLETFWQTEQYQRLKQKIMTQPEAMTSEEFICFVLTRDGGEIPYNIPLQQLKQAIEEKKEVLHPITLKHLIITQEIIDRDNLLTYEEKLKNEFCQLITEYCTNRDCGFLNLAKVDLSNMDLRPIKVPLYHAYLVRANLSHTILTGVVDANLSYVDLSYACFMGSIFDANLYRCNLSHAKIEASSISRVDLICADLTNTKLDAYLENVNFQNAIFNETNFDYGIQENVEFFSSTASLSQLESECISIMTAMTTCVTPSKEIHKAYNRPDDIDTLEFDEDVYVAIAKDLVSKLEAVDNVTLKAKIAFIDSIYRYFEPKSKANNYDIAKSVATFFVQPTSFLENTINKDIGWARFFRIAEPMTKSQAILDTAKMKMLAACQDDEERKETFVPW
jgi:uncharacterized protein YjbI with pentapeptide repeats